MASIRRFCEFIFSPTLYKVYNDARYQNIYEPNSLEKLGDQVINSLFIMWNIGLYSTPLIATVLYKRGYIVFESLALVTKVLLGLGLILSSSYCIRGLGRLNNPAYVTFYEVLSAAKKSLSKENKKALSRYDFDFREWPIEFKWSDVEVNDGHVRFHVSRPSTNLTFYDTLTSLPCRILSYLSAHTFGIKMVYPGSIKTYQYFLFSVILQGREKLILDHEAERCKIRTRDGNDIDTLFIDGRNKVSNGEILVICCEGNAGFYESGIAMTPIKANYSILGWNHPGFGGSSGTPFPSQEQNAIDCVMQFAINYLRFNPENIIVFGWSIGGYTASWAAMNYPDIKGVVLDATFDDILPLAVNRMPSSWESLVKCTIRTYINLNVYEQMSRFNGPALFIRRTKDEIICTEEGNLSTNRGNHLVAKFLKHRYPKLIGTKQQNLLNEWLASDSLQQSLMWDNHNVNRDHCNALISSYLGDDPVTYPMQIGADLTEDLKNRLTLFLVDAHLKNYHSTHCTPLPVNLFRIPWSPVSSESSFVKL